MEAINGAINNFAWGPLMLLLLVGTGVYLTCRVNWLQVTHFGRILKNTVGTLFKGSSKKDHGANISPFEAVTTALAGTVGTGNIAGVTGAIFTGGAGAVFWMWVAAFFGMVTKYAEIVLAMKFRVKDERGTYHGGPMYYIENGIGKNWKWLAIVFCLLGGFASFGIGNIAQSSEISGALKDLFHLPPIASGILIAIVGVANTLGLSVVERMRESATLRAIGMTRRQLKSSLAVEAILISVANSFTGCVLGSFFGWLGARSILSNYGKVAFVPNWGLYGIVFAVAVIAALLASIVPARRAVKTAPMQALAEA